MVKAVIVYGRELKFSLDVHVLTRHLDQVRGATSCLVPCRDLDYREFHSILSGLLKTNKSQTLLLAYAGHGLQSGWHLNPGVKYPYRELRKLLRKRQGRVLILNDCCHARGLVESFGRRLPANISVISASQSDMDTAGGLIYRAAKNWSMSREVQPHRVMRRVKVRRSLWQWLLGREPVFTHIEVEEDIRDGRVFDCLFYPN